MANDVPPAAAAAAVSCGDTACMATVRLVRHAGGETVCSKRRVLRGHTRVHGPLVCVVCVS